jgi:integron integrase
MNPLKPEVVAWLERRLGRAKVPESEWGEWRKWARYYLDFCAKYGFPPRSPGSLGPFLDKLKAKGQDDRQRDAAQAVVTLLLASQQEPVAADGSSAESHRSLTKEEPERLPDAGQAPVRESQVCVTSGSSWQAEFEGLTGAIRLRNYSASTLRTYRHWVAKFQAFVRSKAASELGTEDAKAFLTELAVRHGVAASTQNQAFNALLFFYRHVLGREFGQIEGVVRAKRRRYIPVVLSRSEVAALLDAMEPEFRLAAMLMYGCGLRLFECIGMRLHNFNLDEGLLTIHDGKGQKDRVVPLPERAMGEVRAQIVRVGELHKRDLERGYAGVFLPTQLEGKYRSAARDLRWQWFFPAAKLTKVAATGEWRRYHLHDSQVQAAVKRGAEAAGIMKRVSPHTLRHTFASHLLLEGYDLPTIQKLLGHGDIRTTMIYVQTVPSKTVKAARSPLDL